MTVEPIRARYDESCAARLSNVRPLLFDSSPHALGLPDHVRAGSAIRRLGERLVILQDDVNALAVLDEITGTITPVALPPGADGGRIFGDRLGNKALKMDLEACIALPDGRLVGLGSGSTAHRERVVIVTQNHGVRVLDAATLYANLRANPDFAGSELNVEGAVVVEDRVRLFQRGNGAARDDRSPVNAIGDLDLAAFLKWLDGGPAPRLSRVLQVDLGSAHGVPFGFTDATSLPDGRIAFLAGAEDSPDTFRDGDVVGCRFGIIDGDDIRIADIIDEHGVPACLKLEGLDWVDSTSSFVAIADLDDPDAPALLATLQTD